LRPGDPEQIGQYRLFGRLGSGGMGQVFIGESSGRRRVAVKLLLNEYAGDRHFRERFTREVKAARKAGGLHTARIVDADPDADPPWLVTAYTPGPSLADAVKATGPMGPVAVAVLGAALSEGLAAIHACGLIHRDLKPGNIILADDGPRIIDFGVARGTEALSGLTDTGDLAGTLTFMSPEQIRGEKVSARSDIFSLGSVLAYAANGRGPFDADTMAGVLYRITSQDPDLGGLAEPMRTIVRACLAKTPADRPSPDDLSTWLASQDHIQDSPATERPVLPVPLPAPAPRGDVVSAAGVASGAGGGGTRTRYSWPVPPEATFTATARARAQVTRSPFAPTRPGAVAPETLASDLRGPGKRSPAESARRKKRGLLAGLGAVVRRRTAMGRRRPSH
jgi:serine/threonine protein kinase